ncbi:hypothetical protein FEM03_10825 [Phragmitibacter flavus]|uniref:Uncharacterized protein n=1 Tax=Phragmitibacter flavus TaxID=2576071 RepID=A0A5R8KES8_9BACT|nr:hypothetical protein [Phragmitibacter flavus]TLD70794.1 hypothetical protein FEM03_10825 [Phragmitibacter flavus]
MPATLPDCDEVFSMFFDRWYDDDDRQRKGFTHTRPDMMVAFRPGYAALDLSPLSDASQKKVMARISTMFQTCKADWPSFLPVSGDIDERWIDAFDNHFNAGRIAALIEEADPEDFANSYVVSVCQFGAVLGHVMKLKEPRLLWVPDWPYWESSLYDPVTGQVIPPFHWAIKKFSSYGVDDGYVAKIGCMLDALNDSASP